VLPCPPPMHARLYTVLSLPSPSERSEEGWRRRVVSTGLVVVVHTHGLHTQHAVCCVVVICSCFWYRDRVPCCRLLWHVPCDLSCGLYLMYVCILLSHRIIYITVNSPHAHATPPPRYQSVT